MIHVGHEPDSTDQDAVYNLKYYMVWVRKYRELVLKGGKDRVHLFLTGLPRYSPSQIVRIMKGVLGKIVFKEYPEVEEQLWGTESSSDGYFVRSVGNKLTSEVIRRDIKYQHQERLGFDF